MSTDPSSEDLHRLASGFLDGTLPPEEMSVFLDCLARRPEARQIYRSLCELEALLIQDGAVRQVLADADDEPANVLPLHPAEDLPDAGTHQERRTETPRPTRPGRLAILAGLAAAVILTVAYLLRSPETPLTRPPQPAGTPLAVAVQVNQPSPSAVEAPLPPPAPVVLPPPPAQTPEEAYARLQIADNGSNKRPPAQGGSVVAKVRFNRDVRPLLSENCFACHGPDSSGRKADLRLDREDLAFAPRKKAPPVLTRFRAEKSELYRRIAEASPDDLMPPPDSHKKLSPAEIELLRRWIEEGAEWEEHWAFIPPKKTEPPQITGDTWSRNEIDRFILEEMGTRGLKPSAVAEPHTLLRRLTLDLTGLPPTPEESAAFARDPSPEAYEKAVDRLLQSEHYGEHRARYWLDAARYADTHGLHLDNYREMWAYRDWVVSAFNANLPFDRFTLAQLAGDLLPNATEADRIATGFIRCNVTSSEGGAIPEEFAARYAVDRTSTMGTVWMGLTLGCCACHDHKFDPVTQKEFYSLLAYFNNLDEDPMDKNDKNSRPAMFIGAGEPVDDRLTRARAAATGAAKARDTALAATETAYQAWVTDPATRGLNELPWPVPPVFTLRTEGAAEVAAPFDVRSPFAIQAAFTTPATTDSLPVLELTDASGRVRFRLSASANRITAEIYGKSATDYAGSARIRGVRGETRYEVLVNSDGSGNGAGLQIYLNGAFATNNAFSFGQLSADSAPVNGIRRGNAAIVLESAVGFPRYLGSKDREALKDRTALPGLLRKPADKRNDTEKKRLREAYAQLVDPQMREPNAALAAAEAAASAIETGTPLTLIAKEKTQPAMAHVLFRGEYDQPREPAPPGVPQVLPSLPENAPANRLSLARWLVAPEHPLTARVTVNRFWQELFGTGLVKTAEDFGVQGERPSHPELLDWLAVDFREHGWDVRRLLKTLVMSATYRQTSSASEEQYRSDPENRLHARGPRFRLDAEMIRDQVLFSSGILSTRRGGPSVKPDQPGNIWEVLGYQGSNTMVFFPDQGDNLYRRSLYTFWKRTAPPPNMTLFDAPNRESCTVRRERTNTPLQALVMMNDTQYLEAARSLAATLMETGTDSNRRMATAFQRVVGRPIDTDSRQVLEECHTQYLEHFQQQPGKAAALLRVGELPSRDAGHPAETAALALVISQLFNLAEVLNKN